MISDRTRIFEKSDTRPVLPKETERVSRLESGANGIAMTSGMTDVVISRDRSPLAVHVEMVSNK